MGEILLMYLLINFKQGILSQELVYVLFPLKAMKALYSCIKEGFTFLCDDASHYCGCLRQKNNYAVKNLASLHLKGSPCRNSKD